MRVWRAEHAVAASAPTAPQILTRPQNSNPILRRMGACAPVQRGGDVVDDTQVWLTANGRVVRDGTVGVGTTRLWRVVHDGWAFKRGAFNREFRERFLRLTLSPPLLRYYKTDRSALPQGSIRLVSKPVQNIADAMRTSYTAVRDAKTRATRSGSPWEVIQPSGLAPSPSRRNREQQCACVILQRYLCLVRPGRVYVLRLRSPDEAMAWASKVCGKYTIL